MTEIKITANKLLDLVPKNAQKTIVFCEVEKTSYEFFFYSFFENGKWVQSNEMVDQEQIDEESFMEAIDQLVKEVRSLAQYNPEMRNIISGEIGDKTKIWSLEQTEKTVGLYKIKKEWKSKHSL